MQNLEGEIIGIIAVLGIVLCLVSFLIFKIYKTLEKLAASEKSLVGITTLTEDAKALSLGATTAANQVQGAINTAVTGTVSFQDNLIEQTKAIHDVLTNPIDAGKLGEISLENFLENSELPSEHYEMQPTYTFTKSNGQEETYRPDAVITIPGNTKLIIDAKTNSREWIKAFKTEDEEEKERLLVDNTNNVEKTARDLSFKPYDQLDDVVVPNMIIMYIPIDNIYLEFLKRKGPDFLNEAYSGLKKRGSTVRGVPILFTTPSLIGGLLRIIIWLWREKEASKDRAEILKTLRNFKDDLRIFLANFLTGTKKLSESGSSFKTAYGNLQNLSKILERMENFVSIEEVQTYDPKLVEDLDKTIIKEPDEPET